MFFTLGLCVPALILKATSTPEVPAPANAHCALLSHTVVLWHLMPQPSVWRSPSPSAQSEKFSLLAPRGGSEAPGPGVGALLFCQPYTTAKGARHLLAAAEQSPSSKAVMRGRVGARTRVPESVDAAGGIRSRLVAPGLAGEDMLPGDVRLGLDECILLVLAAVLAETVEARKGRDLEALALRPGAESKVAELSMPPLLSVPPLPLPPPLPPLFPLFDEGRSGVPRAAWSVARTCNHTVEI
jgi:hypothetical protein